MTDPSSVVPGTELGERYRLQREIGRGAVARVWEAQDLRLERTVAVKTLVPDADRRLDRFEEEARTAAALDHPAVVDVLDVGRHGDTSFLVMKLVEGVSLADALAAGPLPPGRARVVVAAVAEGLAAAHGAGIVHGDVKPGNILLPTDGTAMLADFGVARWLEDATTGPLVGTSSYLAPEQLTDPDGTTAAVDVYALGLVLLETLTGVRPFDGEDVRTRLEHGPTVPDTLPDDLAELARAATALAPGERPTAAALAERLHARPVRDRTRVLTAGGELPAVAAADDATVLLPAPGVPADDATVLLPSPGGAADDATVLLPAVSVPQDAGPEGSTTTGPPVAVGPVDEAQLVGLELPDAVEARLAQLRASGADARGRLGAWWRDRGRPWWDDHLHVPRGVVVVGAALVVLLLVGVLSRGGTPPPPDASTESTDGSTLPPSLEDALTQLQAEVDG